MRCQVRGHADVRGGPDVQQVRRNPGVHRDEGREPDKNQRRQVHLGEGGAQAMPAP
jgi:hypothetical protein